MGLLHARKKLPIQELIWNIFFMGKLIVKGRQRDFIMKDQLGIILEQELRILLRNRIYMGYM